MRSQLSQAFQARLGGAATSGDTNLVINLNDLLSVANQLLGQVHIAGAGESELVIRSNEEFCRVFIELNFDRFEI